MQLCVSLCLAAVPLLVPTLGTRATRLAAGRPLFLRVRQNRPHRMRPNERRAVPTTPDASKMSTNCLLRPRVGLYCPRARAIGPPRNPTADCTLSDATRYSSFRVASDSGTGRLVHSAGRPLLFRLVPKPDAQDAPGIAPTGGSTPDTIPRGAFWRLCYSLIGRVIAGLA